MQRNFWISKESNISEMKSIFKGQVTHQGYGSGNINIPSLILQEDEVNIQAHAWNHPAMLEIEQQTLDSIGLGPTILSE